MPKITMKFAFAVAIICMACVNYGETPKPPPEPPFDVVTHIDGWEIHKIGITCQCPANWYCAKDACLCTINKKGDAIVSVVMNCGGVEEISRELLRLDQEDGSAH
jgi:hypothetical protein